MNLFWLITSTTYGTWLPGDKRGFVSTVEDGPGPRVRHNTLGTPYDADMPELRQAARAQMKGPPVYLNIEQAGAVLDQIRQTSDYRRWGLHAAAVMANHFHVVAEAPEEVLSTKILGDLKSYAARALNRLWQRPLSGTWWTESGSRRLLRNQAAIEDRIIYVVLGQYLPLVTWFDQQHAALIASARERLKNASERGA
jgi:REP element-mobilizing transposase RayT